MNPVTRTRAAAALLLAALTAASGPAAARSWLDWWLTPDQQGRRLEAAGDPAAAAARYTDPLRRGVALYRAGEFEAAADAFARSGTSQASFNRGNALVLLGRYDDAIASYEEALAQRPDWVAATQNLAITRLRKERRDAKSDEDQGTGGKLEADEIVFDQDGRTAGQQQTDESGTGAMSVAEVEAMWLRRVQTRPADFLRAKFAYELAARAGEPR